MQTRHLMLLFFINALHFSSTVLPRDSQRMSSPLPATSNQCGGYLALNISKEVKSRRIEVQRASDEVGAHGVG